MPRSSRRRDPSARRSRSSGSRSRSRHRTHSSCHRRRRSYLKIKEKNFWSALCNMISIVIMCTSLAEPRWISLRGGGCQFDCTDCTCTTMDHLGAYQFFYPGSFRVNANPVCATSGIEEKIYQYGPDSKRDVMYNCVTQKAVVLMKTIIAFTFIAMGCSLFGFLLDLIGPTQRSMKILHRNAIMSIVSVILCVITNLFCYWMTVEVQWLQKVTKIHTGSKVVVTFDISFYLITAAGAMGVLATALNCLRRYPIHDDSQTSEPLLEDYDGMDTLMIPPPPPPPPEDAPPPPDSTPPPAYSP